MLNIDMITFGQCQTNCYIIRDTCSKTCAVIDPGYEPETVLEKVESLGLTVEAILLTHGHFDHVGGVKNIAAETGCRVYLCEPELSLPPVFTAGRLYYTDLYREGDVLNIAGLTIRVIQTPGHTGGCVCLLTEDVMFSGDTLFRGSCGRLDLPGANPQEMENSLSRLAHMERNVTIYPGHGSATTLDEEKQYNPYLRGTL